jgi:hypothetical protein
MFVRRFAMHAGHADPALTKDADDAGGGREALSIYMLMPVNEHLRPRSLDVGVESLESNMDTIVPLMDQVRRIMGNENIDGGERFERFLHVLLLV